MKQKKDLNSKKKKNQTIFVGKKSTFESIKFRENKALVKFFYFFNRKSMF